MDERLKVQYTKDEISLAAWIGSSELSSKDKVYRLFSDLIDPLLSKSEIIELLANSVDEDQAAVALNELLTDGLLEQSEETQRPLDEEEALKLWRLKRDSIRRLALVGALSRLVGWLKAI